MNIQEIASSLGLILVEIDGSGIEQGRSYTDKATGAVKPLPGRQTAYIWQGGRYPIEVSVDVPDKTGPYRPGFYFLGGPLFQSGEYGRVGFKGTRELVLVAFDDVADRLVLDGITGKTAKAA